ncbi:hypothetical protein [Dongia sp.]|uniref:hypothetical protein n=1 Tax=Dongia sp. TaxID=1977262 RepID=UPI0035ADE909
MYFRHAALAVALMALALSACQSSPATKKETAAASVQTPVTEPTIAPSAAGAFGTQMTGVFDDRLKHALGQVVAKIAGDCMADSYGGGSDAYMACYTKGLMNAFDPSGQAVTYCPSADNAEKGMTCALTGAMLRKLREKSGTPIEPASWKKIEGVLAGEMVVTVFDETSACNKEGRTGSDARTCLAEKLMTRLGGDEVDGRACVSIKDDAKFGQCIGEGATTKLLEDLAASETL